MRRRALAAGRAVVVALESTIISHGLPRPDNLRIAREIEQAVRDAGRRPGDRRHRRRAGPGRPGRRRAGGRSPAATTWSRSARATWRVVAARGGYGATTVASTAHLAALAGIAVFATGGLGGVHRGAATTYDESADLFTLARVPTTVVCAGVKSILDVPATLERLESYGVGLVGYGTNAFPGFYLTDSGHPVEHRVDTPEEVAAVMVARERARHRRQPRSGRGQPGAGRRAARPRRCTTGCSRDALAGAEAEGIHGKDVTPYLLARFHHDTEGASLRVNTTIILRNAALAARIALARSANRPHDAGRSWSSATS